MPTKRTRTASAKEQYDDKATLSWLDEKIENRQWEEIMTGMPLLAEPRSLAKEDNITTEKALYAILSILTIAHSGQASQEPEKWIYLKEMTIDILQGVIDDSVQGSKNLFPKILVALVGTLTNEKDSKQSLRLREKAARCINSLLCQSPENKRYMRSEMGLIQALVNQLVEEQDIPLQMNLLGIVVRISPKRLQDLNQFAKALFSEALVPSFLRVAPESFVADAREFVLAVQASKPDAHFGWTLRSDSVRFTSISKVEHHVCYVDFNPLNMQVIFLGKENNETLTIPYGDVKYWTFDVNSHFFLVTNESKAIDIKVNSKREAARIQHTMETAHAHQHEKSSVPLSVTLSAIANAAPSFPSNSLIQNALHVIDKSHSTVRASEPSLRMNTKPMRQYTQIPSDDDNKLNIRPKASQDILYQRSRGRSSNSTMVMWLNSAESVHTTESEPEGDMEAAVRIARRPLESAPGNGRGVETFEIGKRHSHAPMQVQSTPVTPLPGPLRPDCDLRQQFLDSLNIFGKAVFDQIEQRIQDSRIDEDKLFQRIERKVDEAVESRVRQAFLKISPTIETANTRDKCH